MTSVAPSTVKNNLPAEHTPPIGRERDTAAVRAFLLDSRTPLVTLVGPGGMGKTTLALHLAHDILSDFPDGVHFIDLTPLAQPDLIPSHIARTVGAEETPGQTAEDTLIEHYHDRRALLLLDNFEHLLPGAKAVGGLLRACPGVRVLATSREALRLREEQVHPLPPLALPDRDRTSDIVQLIHNPAVDLFVQRARAVRPGFQLTADNAAAVAAIVTRLDGLPLAIELAAARVRLFPPTVLRQRLEASPLGLLIGGARDAPERQQTLRATIAWSYDLLEPDERRLFRRLGVFADGFTLAAVESVVAEAFGDIRVDVLDGLESLLDKSLIVRLPVEDELRFGLLETLRAFALDQLAAEGEEPAARRAHFDHYLALAEQAAAELRGPKQAAWVARLAADENNLRAALEWSLGRPADGGVSGLQLAGALGDFWYFGNRSIEGRRWLARTLAVGGAASTREQMAVRARGLSAAGTMAWLQTDLQGAIAYHEQALAGYRAIDDRRGTVQSLNNLGLQFYHLTAYDQARNLFAESAALWRPDGDDFQLAMILSNQGLLEAAAGDLVAARAFTEEALASAIRSGVGFLTMLCLNNLGQVELQSDRLERADELLHRAFDLAVEINDLMGTIDTGLVLGRLREAQGNPRDAWRLATEALTLANEARFRLYVADGLEQAAFALYQMEEPQRAARLLGAAGALRRRVGAPDSREQSIYYDDRLPAVRAALGAAAFSDAWDAGMTLSREAAIALALAQPAAVETGFFPKNPVSKKTEPLAELTPREREVARLMARGLTNEEIGAELFISLKTVEKHAGNALGKLGFRSRVELAAWIAAGSLPRDGA